MLGNQPFNLGNMFRTALSMVGMQGAPTAMPVNIPGLPQPGQTVDSAARKAATEALKQSTATKERLEKLNSYVSRVQTIAFTAFSVAQSLQGWNNQDAAQKVVSASMALGQTGLDISRSLVNPEGGLNRLVQRVGLSATTATRIGGLIGRGASTFAIASIGAQLLQLQDTGAKLQSAFALADELGQGAPSNLKLYYRLSGATARSEHSALAYGVAALLIGTPGEEMLKGIAERRQAVVNAFRADSLFLAKMTGQSLPFAQLKAQLDSKDPKQVSAAMDRIASKWDLSNGTAVGLIIDSYRTYLQAEAKSMELFTAQSRAITHHRRIRELMN